MQGYSDPKRASDPNALPDIEVFQLTAYEVAERDEDLVYEYRKRHEFRLATMNSKVREAMVDAMVEENGIEGGWFYYWYCFPGCMPKGGMVGPYPSAQDALKAAQDDASE